MLMISLRALAFLPILLATAAGAATFTVSTTIAAGDSTYDGQPIVVSGCTLTVDGSHQFASVSLENGAVLTHAPARGGELELRLDLTIAGALTVPLGCAIDVSGRGYGAWGGPGAGGGLGWDGAGAGHGGLGGGGPAGGPSYGDPLAPYLHGSGGASGHVCTGGAGGGAVRLIVGGLATIDGAVTADAGPGGCGGGSGGSIWLQAATLAGAGTISASGGTPAGGWGGSAGGGGGRIALSSSASTFSGAVTARGGTGPGGAGGAGTVFRQTSGSPGELLVDNGGQIGALTPVAVSTPVALSIRGGARPEATGDLDLASLGLGSGCVLSHPPGMRSATTIRTAGDLTIEAGARLDFDGLGYPTASGPGAGQSEFVRASGAGHGGLGGAGDGLERGPHYGGPTLHQPTKAGSGGGISSGYAGGAGGGAVHLIAGGTLNISGTVSADGRDAPAGLYPGGGGAGGSVWIECTHLAGHGTISANGGAGAGGSGGGGGGRIAIDSGTLSFSGTVTATGGTGFESGGAGTIYRKLAGEPTGRVVVANGTTGRGWTPLESPLPFALEVKESSVIYPYGPLFLAGLHLLAGTAITPPARGNHVEIAISGDATIDAGASIEVSGLGYGSSDGPGEGTDGYLRGGGAGHGGRGGNGSGEDIPGGGVYGSPFWPTSFGSGGGIASGSPGGSGGGSVHLIVGGPFALHGSVLANGDDGVGGLYGGGGGSGGSLLLEVGSLVGSPAAEASANGGRGIALHGGGGSGGGAGGRIAVYQNGGGAGDWPVLRAEGGTGHDDGQSTDDGEIGSVHVATSPAPLRVATHLPSGVVYQSVARIHVCFSSTLSIPSFGVPDVSITTPSGPLAPGDIEVVPLDAALFEVRFPAQADPGVYHLTIGPDITGSGGGMMDQDGNGVPGDPYAGTFTIGRLGISGSVQADDGSPLAGVVVRTTDGTAATPTDASGQYELPVPFGWSGTVEASLAGGSFAPSTRDYLYVEAALAGQDFTLTTPVVPRLDVPRSGDDLLLSWPSLGGMAYQLQTCITLAPPSWSNAGLPQAGTGALLHATLPLGPGPHLFFRLLISSAP